MHGGGSPLAGDKPASREDYVRERHLEARTCEAGVPLPNAYHLPLGTWKKPSWDSGFSGPRAEPRLFGVSFPNSYRQGVLSWTVLDLCASPILGSRGEPEFLIHVGRPPRLGGDRSNWRQQVPTVIREALDLMPPG